MRRGPPGIGNRLPARKNSNNVGRYKRLQRAALYCARNCYLHGCTAIIARFKQLSLRGRPARSSLRRKELFYRPNKAGVMWRYTVTSS